MNGIEKLKKIIDDSSNIVFFGGAGVSTESGIPDFRSVDGLYSQKYDYPPETILSHTFYRRNPKEFYRFYKDKMLCLTAKPNAAHYKLAEWERTGKLKAIITQNIDEICIKRPEVGRYSSSMDRYTVIIVKIAGSYFRQSICFIPKGCLTAMHAADRLNPMWCSMKKAWIHRRYRRLWNI